MSKPNSISLIFPVYKDKFTVIRVINKRLKILKKYNSYNKGYYNSVHKNLYI